MMGYRCKDCNLIFSNIHELFFHDYKCYDNGPPYVCTVCDKTFTIKKSLLWHFHVLHNIIQHFHCAYCNCSFQTTEMLAAHTLRYHSSQ